MDRDALLELLIYSMDNPISEIDQAKLDRALETDHWLIIQQQNLLKLRAHLENKNQEGNIAIDYSDKILSSIEKERFIIQPGWLGRLYPRVAVACVLIVLFSMLHLTFSSDKITVDALVGLEDIAPEDAYTYLNFQ